MMLESTYTSSSAPLLVLAYQNDYISYTNTKDCLRAGSDILI